MTASGTEMSSGTDFKEYVFYRVCRPFSGVQRTAESVIRLAGIVVEAVSVPHAEPREAVALTGGEIDLTRRSVRPVSDTVTVRRIGNAGVPSVTGTRFSVVSKERTYRIICPDAADSIVNRENFPVYRRYVR